MGRLAISTVCGLALSLLLGSSGTTAHADQPGNSLLSSKVIGGTLISDRNSPVVLRTESWSCTGTLIAPKVILTASHCVKDQMPGPVIKPSRMVAFFNGRRFSVARIKVHRQSDLVNDPNRLQDLALLFLKKKIPTKPVPILLSRDLTKGDLVRIVGFGESHDLYAGELHEGYAHVDDIRGNLIRIKIKQNESSACIGDSGGPILSRYLDANGMEHSGIVGTVLGGDSKECRVGESGYYTRLQTSSATSFILKNVPGVQLQ
jgi:secreted trypsin-like serine protease